MCGSDVKISVDRGKGGLLMKVNIEVKGNAQGTTTPPLAVGGFTFNWTDSSTIVAESSTVAEAAIDSIFPQLQSRLLYQLLAPIQLYASIPGRVDIILSDPRVFHGPAPAPAMSSDIPNIRDVIVEYELAAGSLPRTHVLQANAPLLYALEHLIRAILTPESLLPELYKAIEAIKDTLV